MDPLHKKHVGAIGREYVPSLYWGRLCGRKARGTSSWTIASSPVQIIEVCRHHVKFVLQMFNSAGGLNVFTSKLSLQAPSQLNHKLKEFYMPYERHLAVASFFATVNAWQRTYFIVDNVHDRQKPSAMPVLKQKAVAHSLSSTNATTCMALTVAITS